MKFIVRGLNSQTKKWEILGHSGKCKHYEDNVVEAIAIANVYLFDSFKNKESDMEYSQVRIEQVVNDHEKRSHSS